MNHWNFLVQSRYQILEWRSTVLFQESNLKIKYDIDLFWYFAEC